LISTHLMSPLNLKNLPKEECLGSARIEAAVRGEFLPCLLPTEGRLVFIHRMINMRIPNALQTCSMDAKWSQKEVRRAKGGRNGLRLT
jgi:hypothetical protein